MMTCYLILPRILRYFSEIAAITNSTPSAISHQLRVLKQAKLVKGRKDGKAVYYSLDDEHVRTIYEIGKEHVEEEQV